MRGARQLLLEEGIPEHVLNKWTEAADHELDTTKFHNWLRFRYAWGQTPSPDNVPAPSPSPSRTYAPAAFRGGMTAVPAAPMADHTEHDGPVRGVWDPPKPAPRYQQFKCKTREEAAVDVARRERLVRERESLIGGLIQIKQ